jgi:TRAP-type C4-dicarboxylate transport system permease small subunit
MQKTALVLDRAFKYIAVASIVVVMLLTSVDALSRYFLRRPVQGAVEIITDYALPMMVFLAAAHAYRHGGFIRVTIIRAIVPARVALVMDLVAQALTGLIALLFTYASGIQALAAYREGTLSNGVYEYSLWPAYWIVFVGLALMTFYVVTDLAHVRSGRSGLLKEAEAV